jgi:hypothetical protein
MGNGESHDVDIEPKGTVLWIFMNMHLLLHIYKEKKISYIDTQKVRLHYAKSQVVQVGNQLFPMDMDKWTSACYALPKTM